MSAVAVPPLEQDPVELVREATGVVLDEWQHEVLAASELRRPDGRWQHFEVGLNVPRQNGKGGVAEARALRGLFLYGERYLIWSAHNADTAMEAFTRLENLILDTPELLARVARNETGRINGFRHGSGTESIRLQNGAQIRFRTRTKGGGRGFTADWVLFDEAMFLNEAFHGALLPTLSARSLIANPQVWYMGSAADELVHEHAIVWARVRERGLRGDDPSLAYFEWSAGTEAVTDPDEVPVEMAIDPAAWQRANPALGIRISEEHVGREQRSMDPRMFAVERLGIGAWPRTDGLEETVIHVEAWAGLTDADSLLLDPVFIAFDVSPDRSSASIAAAGRREDGLVHVEVIEQKRGTGWVVDQLAVLQERHDPYVIVCDKFGPAGSLLSELENRDVEVSTVTGTEYAQCCGRFVDAVNEKGLRHLGSSELLNAIRGSKTRTLGDAWAWSRKSSATDITPLVSATLAVGFALGEVDDGEAPVIF